ncbi:MAG: heat-inducible transcriptional repressor HrcA [Pseudomonadota bacterium]
MSTPLSDLDERSREIFRRIVESYLETGEPLGSRNLSRLLPMQLSPASVRNVMSDLEHLGLVYSPHTSAGRMPTEQGLRFFVDAFLEFGDLTEQERTHIETLVKAADSGNTIEGLLTEASQMLSGLSRGAGLVISQKQDVRVRHIEFVLLEPTKALVVMVGEDGVVENRLIEIPVGMPSSALTQATNYLNANIKGRTISEALRDLQSMIAADQAALDKLTAQIIETGLADWSGRDSGEPRSLIVRGRSNLLDDVQAHEDLERIRLLFDDLETKRDLTQLLSLAQDGDGVRIFIGSENKLFSLSGSSVVVAPYRDAQQRVVGALGVIGPTRLNYSRVVPMVDYTAKVVSTLFG